MTPVVTMILAAVVPGLWSWLVYEATVRFWKQHSENAGGQRVERSRNEQLPDYQI